MFGIKYIAVSQLKFQACVFVFAANIAERHAAAAGNDGIVIKIFVAEINDKPFQRRKEVQLCLLRNGSYGLQVGIFRLHGIAAFGKNKLVIQARPGTNFGIERRNYLKGLSLVFKHFALNKL